MSRVEGDSPAHEAERLQKEADKRAREDKADSTNRETFSKLVKGQQQSRDSQAKQNKGQAEAHAGQEATKGQADAERAARMARGGTLQHARILEQARGFQGALVSAQQRTGQQDEGRVERREQGAEGDRVEQQDREHDVDSDARVEEASAEAKKEARLEAGAHGRVDADGQRQGGRDGGQGGHSSDEDRAAAALAQTNAAASEGAARTPPRQIPPELLEKLVSTVYLAVNDKGLKEFQIELKDGPLKGATLKITAHDGKVGLRFSGLDPQTQNLVEASKGDLLRRLEKKGLALARLEVR